MKTVGTTTQAPTPAFCTNRLMYALLKGEWGRDFQRGEDKLQVLLLIGSDNTVYSAP